MKQDSSPSSAFDAQESITNYESHSTASGRSGSTGRRRTEEQKEKRRAYEKAYREANKDRKAATDKAYRKANKDRKAATNKAWYEANKDRVAATGKAYREANKDRRAATHATWYEAKFFQEVFRRMSGRQQARGYGPLPWTDYDDFYNNYIIPRGIENLVGRGCPYFGSGQNGQFRLTLKPNYLGTMSPDRIDNTKGYSPENIIWCSKAANLARGTLDYETWLKVCSGELSPHDDV